MMMKLQEALNKAIHEFGKDVLIEPRLLNILNDYRAFDEMPAARLIISLLQKDRLLAKLLESKTFNESQISQVAHRINGQYAIDENVAKTVIECISGTIIPQVSHNILKEANDKKSSLNIKKRTQRAINRSNAIVDEGLKNSWTDDSGVVYSEDGKRLIKATNKKISSYTINPGTQVICDSAFINCSLLNSIIIHHGLEHIGESAFENCSKLNNVSLPKSVRHIGKRIFANCTSLLDVIIPRNINNVEAESFYGCSSLQKVSIHEGVNNIGERAFACCESLESIRLPNTMRNVGDYAFEGCLRLNNVSLLAGHIWHIGKGAFANCKSLQGIVIPKFRKIEAETFFGCSSLQEVTIEGGDIEERAFASCESLESITLTMVKYIGDSAFENCSNLKYTSFPHCSIRFIGKRAFANCTSLCSFCLPKSVHQIRKETFMGCDSLQEVNIEAGVKHIEERAFACCKSLELIVFPNTLESVAKDSFDMTPSNLKMKIPEESRNLYQLLMPQYKGKFVSEKQGWFSKLWQKNQ